MYISNATRTTYYFQPKLRNYWQAEEQCQGLRGYLATWTTLAKQQEVEAAFTSRGVLSSNINFYWMGLRINGQDLWPRFTWTTSGLTPKQAKHEQWGTFMPGQHKEPNQIFPAEDCAGANQTEAFRGAWGWADINCYTLGHFICEVPFPSPPPPSPSPPYQPLAQYARHASREASPGSTYFWNPDDYTYDDARGNCKLLGGFLVSYGSLKEQMEVEAAFISQGQVLPRTRSYWIGLRVPEGVQSFWPAFAWDDGTGGPPAPLAPLQAPLPGLCAGVGAHAGRCPGAVGTGGRRCLPAALTA
jgi:hypothetical protein